MDCPKGYIKRSGYHRSHKKKKIYIKPTCVPDKGKPGKTPKHMKVLPPIKEQRLLRGYGYSTKNSASKRHASLDKGAKDKGTLYIQRHLTLIKNYTPKEEGHYKILNVDVEYLKSKYSQEKERSHSRSVTPRSKSKSRKKSVSRRNKT